VSAGEDKPSVPAELLVEAADAAIENGRSVILERHGLVLVPDLTALRVFAQGGDLPDTARVVCEDGREVLVYRWPSLEVVDVFEDEQ
jgi:hypothetical protein